MSAWRDLLHDRPGQRFTRYHERARRRGTRWTLAGGVLLLVVGLLLALTPGPGFVFVLFGAALLAARSRGLARAFDRLEARLRAGVRKFRRSG